MRKKSLISTLLALTGCAAYTEPSLSPNHPASPAAAEAAPQARSRTLDLEAAEPVSPAPTDSGMGHGGHDMGDKSSQEPSAPGIESDAHKHEAPAPSPKDGGTTAMFACPMHPEVMAQKPDQRCPKCGMKLVQKDGGKRP